MFSRHLPERSVPPVSVDWTVLRPGHGATCEASFPGGFADRRGLPIRDRALRFQVFGDPSAPAILVLGGISAHRGVADHDGAKGWWREIVRPGGAIDLERYCVIGADFFPLIDPVDPAAAYEFTTADYADALVYGLRSVGLTSLHAAVGASFGGMIVQQIAARAAGLVDRIAILNAAARTAPLAHAWRRQQWEVIRLAIAAGDPARGVALARALAVTTYRSEDELNSRFADSAEIGAYLDYHGATYSACTSAARYLALSTAVDSHAVDPAAITAPSLIIATDTDRLVPLRDVDALARGVAGPKQVHVVASGVGHDSFLKDFNAIGPLLRDFIDREH